MTSHTTPTHTASFQYPNTATHTHIGWEMILSSSSGAAGRGPGGLSGGNKKGPSSFNLRANKAFLEQIIQQLENERKLRDKDQQYIQQLLFCLNEHGIHPPEINHEDDEKMNEEISPLLQDGSTKSLSQLFDSRASFRSERLSMAIHYENLSYWTMVTNQQIQTVASVLTKIFFGSGPQYRVDILHPITGRIRPASMTLLMGPPGCGKSTLLKALAGRLDANSSSDHLEGRVTYNGMTEKDKLFLLAKLVSYVDELDEHIPLLTVKETFEFAWNVTTGGRHSYLVSDDPVAAAALKKDDPQLVRVTLPLPSPLLSPRPYQTIGLEYRNDPRIERKNEYFCGESHDQRSERRRETKSLNWYLPSPALHC
jgi:energy-coupling factor transporter ATP-binding protein EcfA2